MPAIPFTIENATYNRDAKIGTKISCTLIIDEDEYIIKNGMLVPETFGTTPFSSGNLTSILGKFGKISGLK